MILWEVLGTDYTSSCSAPAGCAPTHTRPVLYLTRYVTASSRKVVGLICMRGAYLTPGLPVQRGTCFPVCRAVVCVRRGAY